MPIQPADVSRFLVHSGWSQARLAWALGINQPRISRFITGLKKPNPQLQAALETFFAHDPCARIVTRSNPSGLRSTDHMPLAKFPGGDTRPRSAGGAAHAFRMRHS